mmetsp:Transcript_5608/g.11819  ORF Transcript_5608/g.11819 Transcript_5608/m.11819 type:complete len:503 (-) Transcript_5608:70-1578(-)
MMMRLLVAVDDVGAAVVVARRAQCDVADSRVARESLTRAHHVLPVRARRPRKQTDAKLNIQPKRRTHQLPLRRCRHRFTLPRHSFLPLITPFLLVIFITFPTTRFSSLLLQLLIQTRLLLLLLLPVRLRATAIRFSRRRRRRSSCCCCCCCGARVTTREMDVDRVFMKHTRDRDLRDFWVPLKERLHGHRDHVHNRRRIRLFKPFMRQQLSKPSAFLRLHANHPLQQIKRLVRHKHRQLILSRQNHRQQLTIILMIERRPPDQQNVQRNARAPRVDLLSAVARPADLLRREIENGTNQRRLENIPARRINARVAKVGEFQHAFVGKQHVFQPHVAMAHAVLVAKRKRLEQLPHIMTCDVFRQAFFWVQPQNINQRPAAAQLHREKQAVVVLQHFIQTHDIRMLRNNVQRLNLAIKARKVRALAFLHDLDRVPLVVVSVHRRAYDSGASTPQNPSQLVLPDAIQMPVFPVFVLRGHQVRKHQKLLGAELRGAVAPKFTQHALL